jgi:ABC-type transport system involved in cytochrome c biogenesis permease subunit
VLFTIAQVTGAIWCWLGWASTFQWVYVHFQAAAVWCFFANYLHLRFLPKWDIRKKAGYALAGSVIMLGITVIGYIRYFGEPRIGG